MSRKYYKNLSTLEKKLLTNTQSNRFLTDLNERYTKFQNDLFDAEKLNVNKNDIINNFLISFNF